MAPGPITWRIVVVDDEATNRLLTSEILQEVGFEVRQAAHGGEALSVIAEWRPHVMLLDLHMPEINGWQVLTALRDSSLRTGLVTVICSGLMHPNETQALRAAGADDVLAKPFTFDALFAMLARHLPVAWRYDE